MEEDNIYVCDDCGSRFPAKYISLGNHQEQVYDFRIHRPSYCAPTEWVKWAKVQKEYEKFNEDLVSSDDLQAYLNEIDCVKEIYCQEFHIQGKVLDVGGHQGRLRHFLSDEELSTYLSVDPYINIFDELQRQPNLLKAYPCLADSCNFLSSHAEHLPIVKNKFDWVHMRSVLDHFQDPYQSLKEANRVLKADGTLLIGLTVQGGGSSKKINEENTSGPRSRFIKIRKRFQREGMRGLIKAVIYHLEKENSVDDHMFHWNYEDLIDLLRVTGFEVVKEHWQKPPFSMCIYLAAKKKNRAVT